MDPAPAGFSIRDILAMLATSVCIGDDMSNIPMRLGNEGVITSITTDIG